jgi:hypothetical protein
MMVTTIGTAGTSIITTITTTDIITGRAIGAEATATITGAKIDARLNKRHRRQASHVESQIAWKRALVPPNSHSAS